MMMIIHHNDDDAKVNFAKAHSLFYDFLADELFGEIVGWKRMIGTLATNC